MVYHCENFKQRFTVTISDYRRNIFTWLSMQSYLNEHINISLKYIAANVDYHNVNIEIQLRTGPTADL